jgi:DNA repair protein RadC
MNRRPTLPGVADATLPGLLPLTVTDHESAAGSEGHRARMRQRLLKAGPESLADYEMLEMILFLALPRRDTKPISKALIAKFRTFGEVISAPAAELAAIEGLGEAGLAALKLVQAAALRLLRHQAAASPVLATWDALIGYLTASMMHERIEQFRILYLDTRNRLIADEVQTRGTINHAPAYPREVARRCLELHANAVILAHNHPSGEPSPSREDVAITKDIERALATMGITVHDHIIVARSRCLSLRQEKLL